jgi:hypothetical protein
MIALRFDDLRQHSDILRLRDGKSLTVRFVEPRDAEALQAYRSENRLTAYAQPRRGCSHPCCRRLR